MRRTALAVFCLWLGLALGAGTAEQARGQGAGGQNAGGQGAGPGEPPSWAESVAPPGFLAAPRDSGPMTWGGVLSRKLRHDSPPGESVAVVAGAGDPAPDETEGTLLPERTVIELFTSQGCAACPPADAFFADLARREGVIALALHVDYWDYIGWADAFARPDHTNRQKAYAKAAGARVIYTPQMVVNGGRPTPGNDARGIAGALDDAADDPRPIELRLREEENGAHTLTARPLRALGEVIIKLVRYRPEATVTIERGENAGRTVSYRNIVTSWEVLGRWDARARLTLPLPAMADAAAEPAVVLFQRKSGGPILAAAEIR